MQWWPSAPQGPRTATGAVVRPVEATEPLGAVAYETQVFETGRLPTRDNAHDWYNALVWLAWPQTKAALNAAQVQGACAAPIGHNGRTRRRDALTLLDENGAVLVTDDACLADAWLSFDWQALFVTHRARWRSNARLFVMGHALLDKLDTPRPAHCAHACLRLMSGDAYARWSALPVQAQRADLDAWLAGLVMSGLQTPACLHPLPVLGVPDWWADNAHSDFYDNPAVFRSGRRRQASP